MAVRRLLYLLALLLALIFFGAYQQWLAWIVLLTVLLFPLFSLFVSLPALFAASISAEAPTRTAMEHTETAALTLSCPLPHPPVKGKLRITRPLTGESWVLRSGDALPTLHCGTLRIAPCKTYLYDYAGLFRKKVRRFGDARLTVLPRRLPMPVPPDLTRFLSCRFRPKFGGGFAEHHELRLYRPGDSLNQVHWKLSAKTGKLMLREPMEPERGLFLLTLDIRGSAEELDDKFGRLLWLGSYLLEQGVSFQIRALAGEGLQTLEVSNENDLQDALLCLLGCTPAAEGSVRDLNFTAAWQHHIGGGADET